MKRTLRLFAVPVLIGGLASAARAQAPAPPADPVLTEVRSLKRLVELQTKEINGLADQLARLRQQIEPHEGAPPPPPPPEAGAHPGSPPAESAPPEPGAEPAAPAGAPEPPRAEATGAGVKHIVAKGETLTSIAKHYNVPLTDLQKANKGLEARKMQIGQVLSIPAAAAASPAPATPASTPTH